MTPAHRAVENEDLPRLRVLLDSGIDVEEIDGGLTLLQHAVDVEIDGHTQTGGPLHVDVTAYLLLSSNADLFGDLRGILLADSRFSHAGRRHPLRPRSRTADENTVWPAGRINAQQVALG